jgi:hypothetical protein
MWAALTAMTAVEAVAAWVAAQASKSVGSAKARRRDEAMTFKYFSLKLASCLRRAKPSSLASVLVNRCESYNIFDENP